MPPLLRGVRVIDLTTVLSGPYATYQLALLGADVIKIEVPGAGDLSRGLADGTGLGSEGMGASFVAQNAGKRSVTLNLKTAGGRDVLTRLVAGADVLVENMRPGVLARLGFGWSQLQDINPALVYCALTGFGQTGPLATRPAYDQIIQGLAGMADVTGLPDGGPLRAGFPVCDTFGGLAAAMAICAALAGRSAHGRGVFVDVSMLEMALTAMGWVVSNQLIAERPAQRLGNDNATSSPSGTFETGDGQLNVATNTQQQFAALCQVCGVPELTSNPLYLTHELRRANRDRLRKDLEAALAARSAQEWETLLAAASVPAGRVLTVAQALEHEQVRARGLLHEVDLPAAGPRRVPVLGSGVHVDGGPLAPAGPPPRLGEHTREVLMSLGYTDDDIARLADEGTL